MAESGLRQASKRVINEQVLRGLKMNSPRSNELINSRLPAFLRRFGREFAVVDGSWFYNDLERGEIDYRAYHFTKDYDWAAALGLSTYRRSGRYWVTDTWKNRKPASPSASPATLRPPRLRRCIRYCLHTSEPYESQPGF